MQSRVGGGRALTLSFLVSIVGAAVALAALVVAGLPRAGFALAVGLLIGGLNGYLVARQLAAGVPFSATSLARLAVLSVLGLAIGLLIGADVAWLTVIGIGVSQLVLAGINAVEVARR